MATNFSLNNYLDIDTSGNVGIGTASPVYKLHAYSNAAATYGAVQSTIGNAGLAIMQGSVTQITGTIEISGGALNVGTATNHPLVFGIGGSEKARLDTNGNIGIGTVANSAARLHTYGGEVWFYNAAAGANTHFGYGTFTGDNYLTTGGPLLGAYGSTIFRSSFNELMRVGTTDGTSPRIGIGTNSNASNTPLHVYSVGPTEIAIESTTNTERSTIKLLTNGNDWEIGARGSSGNPNNSFYIYDNAAGAFRATINSSGKVGFGTTNPQQSLHVGPIETFPGWTASTTPSAITLGTTYSSVAGQNLKLRLFDDGGSTVNGLGISFGQIDYVAASLINHVWYTGGAEYMRINGTGNVGIGTGAPAYKLHAYSSAAATYGAIQSTISNAGLAIMQGSVTQITGAVEISSGVMNVGTATSHSLAFGVGGVERARFNTSGHFVASSDKTYDIGSTSAQWRNIYVANVSKTYSLPDVGGSAAWIRLGTFTASQGGRHLYIKVVTSNGYNALPQQQSEVHIHFKTSNGSSVDSNGFAGDATFYVTNGSTGHNVKIKSNVGGTSATTYEIWFYQGAAYNGTALYTVEIPGDYSGLSWAHDGTTGADPGSGSSTIAIASERYLIQSSVGIGTTTPSSKLHVSGGDIRFDNTYGIIGATNTSGHVLRGTGTRFVPSQLNYSDLAGAPSISGTTNYVAKFNGSSSLTNSQLFDSGTYVGIGITTPSSLLHISSTGPTELTIQATTAVERANLKFLTEGNDWELGARGSLADPSNAFYIWDNAASAYRFVINSSGRVGIGTTNPSQALQIGNVSIGSTNAPTAISLGTSYSDTAGATSKLKLRLYDDGAGTVNGLGISFAQMDYSTMYGVSHVWYINNIEVARIGGTNGYLGIGTASPNAKLDVSAASGAVDIRLSNGGTAYMNLYAGSGVGALTMLAVQNEPLVLGTNNAEKVRILASSDVRVGIGTASTPDSTAGYASLAIRGSSGTIESHVVNTTERFRLQVDGATTYVNTISSQPMVFLTANTEAMRIDSTQNVGIGTATVGAKLHVNSTSGNSTIVLARSGSLGVAVNSGVAYNSGDIASFQYSNGNTSYLKIKGIRHTGGLDNWTTAATRIQQIIDTTNQAYIDFNPLGGMYALAFGTGTSPTERIRIDSSGKVGIGTTNPSQALQVGSSSALGVPTATPTTITIGSDYADSKGSLAKCKLRIYDDNVLGVSNGFSVSANQLEYLAYAGVDHVWYTGGTEYMRINSSANVGIGTGAPAYRLHTYSSAAATYAAVQSTVGNTGYVIMQGSATQITGAIEISSGAMNVGTATNHPLAFATNGSEKVRIVSGGKVGFGTTNPSEIIESYGTDAGAIVHYSGQSRGGLWAFSSGRVAFATTASGDDLVFGYTGSPGSSAGFTERMRIDNGTGYVGIGTTNPDFTLDVRGTHQTQAMYPLTNNAYAIGYDFGFFGTKAYSSVVAYSYPGVSDYRLKEDVRDINGSLQKITRLRPVIYRYNNLQDNVENLGDRVGFIAHELQEHFPLLATGEKDGTQEVDGVTRPKYQSIFQDDLVPYMVDAIKELKFENDYLRSEVQSLKDQISSILEKLNNR